MVFSSRVLPVFICVTDSKCFNSTMPARLSSLANRCTGVPKIVYMVTCQGV